MTAVEGVGDDVRLTLSCAAGPLLDGPLAQHALVARCVAGGELLPFVYRDPIDPDDPDAHRPLRRARLVIIEDGLIPD